jgi:hypothetical protein
MSSIAALAPALAAAAGKLAPQPTPWYDEPEPSRAPVAAPGSVLGSQGHPMDYGLMMTGHDSEFDKARGNTPSAPAALAYDAIARATGAAAPPVAAMKSSAMCTRLAVLLRSKQASLTDDILDAANAASGNLTRKSFGPAAANEMKQRLMLGVGGGAVGGAGIGALLHLMRSKRPDDEDQPSLLGDVARGGLAGGALGTLGGGVAALDAPRSMWNNHTLQGKARPVSLGAMLDVVLGNTPGHGAGNP